MGTYPRHLGYSKGIVPAYLRYGDGLDVVPDMSNDLISGFVGNFTDDGSNARQERKR